MDNRDYNYKQISLLAEALEAEMKLTNKKFIEEWGKLDKDHLHFAYAMIEVTGQLLEDSLVTLMIECKSNKILEQFIEQLSSHVLLKFAERTEN
jgi:hypothetical protein